MYIFITIFNFVFPLIFISSLFLIFYFFFCSFDDFLLCYASAVFFLALWIYCMFLIYGTSLMWQLCDVACGILVPWPRIELGPSAVKALRPNPWTTRECPHVISRYLFVLEKLCWLWIFSLRTVGQFWQSYTVFSIAYEEINTKVLKHTVHYQTACHHPQELYRKPFDILFSSELCIGV